MRDNSGTHQPTSEFRASLEREVSRALRRESATMAEAARGRLPRVGMVVALAVTLAIGTVIGSAPAQIRDARQRDALISVVQAEINIAEIQLHAASADFTFVEARHNAGVINMAEVEKARAELLTAESRLLISKLNLEEVSASGRPARDDLAAPLVGGRDFVSERIRPELQPAQRRLSVAEANLAFTRRRYDLDLVSGVVVQESQSRVAEHRDRIALLAGRLSLREEFLKGGLAPLQLEQRALLLQLRQELTRAQERHQIAEANFAFTRTRAEAGVVGRADLLRAELEVAESAVLIQKLTVRIGMLESGGGG